MLAASEYKVINPFTTEQAFQNSKVELESLDISPGGHKDHCGFLQVSP